MSVLGGAWTPQIIWYLSQGPRRFTELKHDIRGVSAKVLAARLRKLASAGVVSRTALRTSPPTVEYALTDIGAELKPAIEAIASVGHRLKARAAAAG